MLAVQGACEFGSRVFDASGQVLVEPFDAAQVCDKLPAKHERHANHQHLRHQRRVVGVVVEDREKGEQVMHARRHEDQHAIGEDPVFSTPVSECKDHEGRLTAKNWPACAINSSDRTSSIRWCGVQISTTLDRATNSHSPRSARGQLCSQKRRIKRVCAVQYTENATALAISQPSVLPNGHVLAAIWL